MRLLNGILIFIFLAGNAGIIYAQDTLQIDSQLRIPLNSNETQNVFFNAVFSTKKNSLQSIKILCNDITDLSYRYVKKHAWEIIKDGERKAYKEINGLPLTTELSSLTGYRFEPCSQYQIKLYVSFDNGYVESFTRSLYTRHEIQSGYEEQICENRFPYQLKGFNPKPERGFGNGLEQGYWISKTDEIKVSPEGLVSLKNETDRYRVHKLIYSYTDINGCTLKDEKNLFVTKLPEKPEGYLVQPAYENGIINLNVKNLQIGTHIWSGPKIIDYPWPKLTRPYPNKSMEGIYTLRVERNGCIGSADTIPVKFSPPLPKNCPDPFKTISILDINKLELLNCNLTVEGLFAGLNISLIKREIPYKNKAQFYVRTIMNEETNEYKPEIITTFLCYINKRQAKQLKNLELNQKFSLKGRPKVISTKSYHGLAFMVDSITP